MSIFDGLFRRPARQSGRTRLQWDAWPAAVYAIGDIHGSLALLKALEQQIVADSTNLPEGEKWIVTLGDYVDRGPDSAGVLDHLLARPPSGFQRVVLCGNHEDLMLDFLSAPSPNHDWLRLGGDRTLQSYGIDADIILRGHLSRRKASDLLESYIPSQHVTLLRSMPSLLSLPGTVFVHAGIRPDVPLARQLDRDLLWMRPDPEETLAQRTPPLLVVHGHTPAREPFIAPHRICIDTGAFATGVLTAARFTGKGLEALFATAAPATPAIRNDNNH